MWKPVFLRKALDRQKKVSSELKTWTKTWKSGSKRGLKTANFTPAILALQNQLGCHLLDKIILPSQQEKMAKYNFLAFSAILCFFLIYQAFKSWRNKTEKSTFKVQFFKWFLTRFFQYFNWIFRGSKKYFKSQSIAFKYALILDLFCVEVTAKVEEK